METHVAHTKPLSRIQSLAKSCGRSKLTNLLLVIVQSAIRIDRRATSAIFPYSDYFEQDTM